MSPVFVILCALLALGQILQAKPPNVLLIISDDQGWNDYSFMGHPVIKTPHIDRLASQSLVFTRGYVPASLCRPSLATLATGLFPHQHKITSNDPPREPRAQFLTQRKEMISLFQKVPSLPALLSRAEYVSFQTGKWWEGNFSVGAFTDGMTHGDPKRGGRHGDHGLTIARDSMQPIYQFIDKSVSNDKPFFIWYAPFLPHTPHNPPQSILQKYIAPARPLAFSKYYAMCEWFDQSCGKLLDFLDDKNLADNTLVLYVCDNGWIQTENPKNRNFARGKQSPYDGGIRTPIMIRYPPALKPKMDTHTVVSSIDFAPTILSAAGLDVPPNMPGINLLDADALAERKVVFGQIFAHNAVDIHNPASSLRFRWCISDRWKLIWPNEPLEPDARIELYDLIADPYEKINLTDVHPQKVQKLKTTINQWWPLK